MSEPTAGRHIAFDDLQRLADGELPESSSEWTVAHLESCSYCQSSLNGIRQVTARIAHLSEPPPNLLARTHQKREMLEQAGSRGWWRRAGRVGVAAAAIVALLVGLRWARGADRVVDPREDSRTASSDSQVALLADVRGEVLLRLMPSDSLGEPQRKLLAAAASALKQEPEARVVIGYSGDSASRAPRAELMAEQVARYLADRGADHGQISFIGLPAETDTTAPLLEIIITDQDALGGMLHRIHSFKGSKAPLGDPRPTPPSR